MTDRSHEPDLTTPPELAGVLAELVELEPVFHRFDGPVDLETFDDLVAGGFWETGASGRRYSREFVWETVERRQAEGGDEIWSADEFQVREVADETYLLTYTLMMSERVTRRLTVWQRTCGQWTILYHQGTLVTE
ncbi:nuclear transport factor 2 family protein [Gordonia soli]|uniref:DUF4440 domain-containing protein n=1 Tax=Gordonia soli NBRC 108243 TaxID=1223545 RepID=M0QPE8_9ACTN|nr:DUF4440 domain-containing protein [Gordonia soli]GAC69312.1 hypothetical protein GS4_23_01090 [Gordonia soli NBRC 108243]